MNEHNVKGTLDKITGKIKETIGELTHNDDLKREGQLDQAKGAAENAAGHAQDVGKNVVDTVVKAVK
jgi:uncharacterized protein YjbJ (UPF0337 family)